MAQIRYTDYFILIARLALAAVFLVAALPKIQDPVAFATAVEGFRVLDAPWSDWVALVLPWLELVIGFGLLVPWLKRSSGLIAAILLLAFIILHGSAWARGLDISCGCFGENQTQGAPNYLWLILRNVTFLALSLCVLARDWRNSSRPIMTQAPSAS
jgi:uncharacterized membrane protein YphA (DoxX/SURF4 family)